MRKYVDLAKLLFSILIFFSIGRVVVIILSLFGIHNFTAYGEVLLQALLSLIIFLIYFCLYNEYIIEDFKKVCKQKEKFLKYIFKMFFVFMVLKFLVALISSILLSLLNYDSASINSTNQTLVESYIKISPILMFISSVILAPFYEETLFRLGFGKVIKNKWIFIIISGFLFGLMHVFPLDEGIDLTLGIIQSISYISMGLLFAYIYTKTKNVFASMTIHFLNNFISILILINMF